MINMVNAKILFGIICWASPVVLVSSLQGSKVTGTYEPAYNSISTNIYQLNSSFSPSYEKLTNGSKFDKWCCHILPRISGISLLNGSEWIWMVAQISRCHHHQSWRPDQRCGPKTGEVKTSQGAVTVIAGDPQDGSSWTWSSQVVLFIFVDNKLTGKWW